MTRSIQEKIVSFLQPVAADAVVTDVRIGLGYTSVRLDNGNLGLAWTGRNKAGSCTHEAKAGTLAGRPSFELLEMLSSPGNALARTLGLATANALAAGLGPQASTDTEILELAAVQPADHVAMVGFFGPLVPRLRQIGCRLDILELDSDKLGTMSPEQGRAALAGCDVAIITGTSIITGTMDELLAGLGSPRMVIILGPSSFMRAEVFVGTPVTHIAGVQIRNAAAVQQTVSEGGGTMLLKKHMDFVTVCLK